MHTERFLDPAARRLADGGSGLPLWLSITSLTANGIILVVLLLAWLLWLRRHHVPQPDELDAEFLGEEHQRRQGSLYANEGASTINPPVCRWKPRDKFGFFLSHYKREGGGHARYLKDLLQRMLQVPVFLDSSYLTDLKRLFIHGVYRSDALVLLATKSVLLRPFCLLEIWEAHHHGIPVLPLFVSGGGFDEAAATALLADLETELEAQNPGALAQVTQHLQSIGVTVDQMAGEIRTALGLDGGAGGGVASWLTFHPNGSDNQVLADAMDLSDRMAELTQQGRLEWISPTSEVDIMQTEETLQRSRAAPTQRRGSSGVDSPGASFHRRIGGKERRFSSDPRPPPVLTSRGSSQDAVARRSSSRRGSSEPSEFEQWSKVLREDPSPSSGHPSPGAPSGAEPSPLARTQIGAAALTGSFRMSSSDGDDVPSDSVVSGASPGGVTSTVSTSASASPSSCCWPVTQPKTPSLFRRSRLSTSSRQSQSHPGSSSTSCEDVAASAAASAAAKAPAKAPGAAPAPAPAPTSSGGAVSRSNSGGGCVVAPSYLADLSLLARGDPAHATANAALALSHDPPPNPLPCCSGPAERVATIAEASVSDESTSRCDPLPVPASVRQAGPSTAGPSTARRATPPPPGNDRGHDRSLSPPEAAAPKKRVSLNLPSAVQLSDGALRRVQSTTLDDWSSPWRLKAASQSQVEAELTGEVVAEGRRRRPGSVAATRRLSHDAGRASRGGLQHAGRASQGGGARRFSPAPQHLVAGLQRLSAGARHPSTSGAALASGDHEPVRSDAAGAVSSPSQSPPSTQKKYKLFLCCCAEEAGVGALRFLQARLAQHLRGTIFTDAMGAMGAEVLATHVAKVAQSEALLLVQTRGVLAQPSALLEVHAALRANIPVVTVIMVGRGYIFQEARPFLSDLEAHMAAANPEGHALIGEYLREHDLTLTWGEMQSVLSLQLLSIISVSFDPLGSDNQLRAAERDIVQRLCRSKAEKKLSLEGSSFIERVMRRLSAGSHSTGSCSHRSSVSHRGGSVPGGLADAVEGSVTSALFSPVRALMRLSSVSSTNLRGALARPRSSPPARPHSLRRGRLSWTGTRLCPERAATAPAPLFRTGEPSIAGAAPLSRAAEASMSSVAPGSSMIVRRSGIAPPPLA